MKLEAVNSRLNPTIEGFPSKDVCSKPFMHNIRLLRFFFKLIASFLPLLKFAQIKSEISFPVGAGRLQPLSSFM